MPDSFLLEDELATVIAGLNAVQARVGNRVRTGSLEEGLTLPAVTVVVDEEELQPDLSEDSAFDDEGTGALMKTRIAVLSVARDHRTARLLSKAIAFNETKPRSGLHGYKGGHIDKATLDTEEVTPVPEADGSDKYRWVVEATYDVWYRVPAEE